VNSDPVGNNKKVERLNEILFSLNIGFGIAYALFAYEESFRIADAPKRVRELLEGFARTLGSIASLAVSGRTRSEYLRSALIREAIFVGLVLGIAILLYVTVRFFVRAAGGFVFAPISGIAALVAVPGCWLYITHATWSVYDPGILSTAYGSAFALEVAIAGGILYLVRHQAIWCGTLVFALHYIFWVLLMGVRSSAPVIVSIPLSVVFPCAGFAWLRYVRVLQSEQGWHG
jgi:hypothetical protein